MDKGAAIGLDIGGGSTKLGLVAADGELLKAARVVLPEGADFAAIVALYRQAIAALAPDGAALPIGIAYPGHVDRARGVGLNSNVPVLDEQPLVAALSAAALLNDADAAAVAEAQLHDTNRILMVTLGTGIGVSMVVGGRALETAGGTLGDSGHLNLDPSGRHVCRQGCTGCLESVASGEALARDASLIAQSGGSAALAAVLAAQGRVTTADACRAAAGDSHGRLAGHGGGKLARKLPARPDPVRRRPVGAGAGVHRPYPRPGQCPLASLPEGEPSDACPTGQ